MRKATVRKNESTECIDTTSYESEVLIACEYTLPSSAIGVTTITLSAATMASSAAGIIWVLAHRYVPFAFRF